MRILVLSDTHVRRGGSRQLPGPVMDAAGRADLILHAGDVVTGEVLEQLSACAPLHAVLGNNDHELVGRLPASVVTEVGGLWVAMVHDAGPAAGRPKRLKRMFPGADVVVFGHSHLPYQGTGIDGQVLLNPGSPTERRQAPSRTFAWLTAVDGTLRSWDFVDLGA